MIITLLNMLTLLGRCDKGAGFSGSKTRVGRENLADWSNRSIEPTMTLSVSTDYGNNNRLVFVLHGQPSCPACLIFSSWWTWCPLAHWWRTLWCAFAYWYCGSQTRTTKKPRPAKADDSAFLSCGSCHPASICPTPNWRPSVPPGFRLL